MRRGGTIDEAGFREDLQNIARNQYPPLQLIKLPFNWFTPAVSGLVQTSVGVGPPNSASASFASTTAGNTLVAFVVAQQSNPQAFPVVPVVTDSRGNVYTETGGDSGMPVGSVVLICPSCNGGSIVVSASASNPNGPQSPIILYIAEVAGVASTQTVGGADTVTLPGNTGDLALAVGATDSNNGVWTNSSGWLQLQGVPAQSNTQSLMLSQTMSGASSTLTVSNSNNLGHDVKLAMVSFHFGAGGDPTPPPITSLALNGPCNFLALVSEAIDEQGNYLQSGLLGQQAAAGFIRLNGDGNVWIPISFVDPLTPGYVTTNNNYSTTPLAGTGFSALEAPFHKLDWRPSAPINYSGPFPPTTPDGFLLAFVGLSIGVGAGIGSGTSSTHAIPSAAGPVDRKKDAGLLK